MASKNTSTTPTITVGLEGFSVPHGAQIAFFQKGVEIFDKARPGRPIQIKGPDGQAFSGQVVGIKVDTLIDLIGMYGGQSAYTYNRPYSAAMLIQALSDEAGGGAIDVIQLYTAVIVQMDPYTPMVE